MVGKTFEQFMEKVGQVVARVACGMTHDDFADARWRDLYEETEGEAGEEEICETLAEQDEIFAEMYAQYCEESK